MERSKHVSGSRSSRRVKTKMPVGNQTICPEGEVRRIDPVWLFEKSPSGFWKKPQNRRNYLLWLGCKLRFRRMRDW